MASVLMPFCSDDSYCVAPSNLPTVSEKNPAAVALGRLGGTKRNLVLTLVERSAIARAGGKAGGRGRPRPQADGRNPAAVALGKLGAKKRNKALTPEQRREIARKAGKAGGRGRPKKQEGK